MATFVSIDVWFVCVLTVPSIPGVCATRTWTQTSLSLAWPASYGTQFYEVSDTGNVIYKNDTSTTTIVSSLSVGQLYSFRIRPFGLNNLYGEYVNCATDSTRELIENLGIRVNIIFLSIIILLQNPIHLINAPKYSSPFFQWHNLECAIEIK